MTLLSIIIVNWNTRELLRDCLKSVADKLGEMINHEIIVVDNASNDGSTGMVLNEFPGVMLIENGENAGFACANNQATSIASGKYLLLLNSDTKLIGDNVCDVLNYLDLHPKVGIATGKMLYEDGEFQPSWRRFPSIAGAIWGNTFDRIVAIDTPFQKSFRYKNLDPDKINEIDWVIGAYLYVRAELLEDGKLFDEDIFMYYEDTLLCKRAWKSGYSVIYLPLAPVIHYRAISAKKIRAKTMLYSFQSSVVYVERLHGATIAGCYRHVVRTVWRFFGLLFWLFPFRRFREKSDLFWYLLWEDSKS